MVETSVVARFFGCDNLADAARYVWTLEAQVGAELEKAPYSHGRIFGSMAKTISERVAPSGSKFRRVLKAPFDRGLTPFNLGESLLIPHWHSFSGVRNVYVDYVPSHKSATVIVSAVGDVIEWFEGYEKQLLDGLPGSPFHRCGLNREPWDPWGTDHASCSAIFTRRNGVQHVCDFDGNEWTALVAESLVDGPKRRG